MGLHGPAPLVRRTTPPTFGAPALDPSFASDEQGPGDAEPENEEEEEDGPDEEEGDDGASRSAAAVPELARALLREYLHKRGWKETLRAFDAECPRGTGTLDSRQALKERLHLKDVMHRNLETRAEPSAGLSILEHMVADRVYSAPASAAAKPCASVGPRGSSLGSSAGSTPSDGSHRGSPHPECGHAAKGRRKKRDSIGYEMDSSGSKIMLAGEIELSSQRIRSTKAFSCHGHTVDLESGKLISDVSELDLDHEIPLGSGASGRVSQVLHVPSGQFVAVKKISIHDEQLRKEILKELHLLYCNVGGLTSRPVTDPDLLQGARYIIRFFGAFYHEGSALIALECMVGSLEDILAVCGTIPEEVVRAVSFQTVHALHYLHKAHHIQHRDIKPANLLLGKDGRVKVSDFGVASDENLRTMAPAQTFIGTMIYMSPERLRGTEYGATADMWSLGLVLLQLATGTHPFKGADMYKIMHISEAPKLPDRFSKDFCEFIGECLKLQAPERATSEEIRAHRWISHMTEGRSERIIMEWASPIILQLEMKRANSVQPNYAYDILDNAIL